MSSIHNYEKQVYGIGDLQVEEMVGYFYYITGYTAVEIGYMQRTLIQV